MYVRLCKTVRDVGVLLRPDEVESKIDNREVDWYRSAFTYGEDAKEYWEQHNGIKGYNGDAFTNVLYFDLDCKQDFEKARVSAVAVCDKMKALGFETEIYFSGNKGFHILVPTTTKFTREETQMICHNIAREAQVPDEVFDTSVYNVTRIFRVVNTKHQESGLYKIPLTFDELASIPEEAIRKLAAQERHEEFDITVIEAKVLKEKYVKKLVSKDNVYKLSPAHGEPHGKEPDVGSHHDVYAEVAQQIFTETGLDLSKCPPGHRKCIWTLEQGHFGPGERHNAIIRLAAYYKAQGFHRKYADTLIQEVLNRRAQVFTKANKSNDAENQRDIDQIYSKDWKGGMFTCRTDAYLQSKCDKGAGPCCEVAKTKARNVMNISQLFNSYVEYSQQALADYPKFGIRWLDDRIRLRPKNFTVLNGANGSGKTSLAIQALENFNAQKMYNIVFSMDMADSSIFEKLGARYTQYNARQIEEAFNVHTFNHNIVNEVKSALEAALPYTLFDFTSSATMNYIEETVLALKNADINIQVAVVDYVGRIAGDKENQFANSTYNALVANDVAKRTGVHFVFLSQVSRENGDHTDPLLTSRVSKDSGAWEENATAIINCWRTFGNGITGEDNYINMYIGKNRSGPLGEMVFFWEGKRGQITEMTSKYEFAEYEHLCQSNELKVRIRNPFMDGDEGEDPTEVAENSKFSPKRHEGPKMKMKDEPKPEVKEENVNREKVSDFKPERFRRNK